MPTPISKTEGSNSTTQSTPRRPHNASEDATGKGHDVYVMPIVHVTLPETAVDAGFWAVLVGTTVLGAVDLPLAALIGVGVLIAKHQRSR